MPRELPAQRTHHCRSYDLEHTKLAQPQVIVRIERIFTQNAIAWDYLFECYSLMHHTATL